MAISGTHGNASHFLAGVERGHPHEVLRAGALGAVVALLQQREHPLAKWREHRAWPLAPEKVATQFAFQKLDRARQRRLCYVAFFRRAGEIQRPRDCQEISNLVHFHADFPLATTKA